MPNTLLSSVQVLAEIDRQHIANGIDTQTAATFTNSVVEPLKEGIASVNNQVVQYYNRGILEYATGGDLDDNAVSFGVVRGGEQPLSDESSTNFYVSLKKGTAKDYAADPTLPLTIPAEAMDISDSNGITYAPLSSITIEPNSAAGFAGIVSMENAASVGAGQITNITVNPALIDNLDPTKVDAVAFICNNNASIVNDRPAISDKEVRDKCILRVNAMNNTNEIAIRLALVRIGITDVTFKKNLYGFGTLGVLVKVNGTAQLGETTITKLNNLIWNICPFAQIIVPEYMKTKLILNVGFGAPSQIDLAKTTIYNVVKQYFLTLNPGDSLDPDQLQKSILTISGVLQATIRCIFVDGRKVLIKKQMALPDQTFVLDPDDPITYTEV